MRPVTLDELFPVDRMVARHTLELAMVGAFMECVRTDIPKSQEQDVPQRREDAFMVADAVRPEMIDHKGVRKLYEIVLERFAKGEVVTPGTVMLACQQEGEAGLAAQEAIEAMGLPMPSLLIKHAHAVQAEYRVGELSLLCNASQRYLRNGAGKDGGKRLADKLSTRVMTLYADGDVGSKTTLTPSEMIDRIRDRTKPEHSTRVNIPYDALNAAAGPLVGGETLGITAYSNAGKSLLAANLFGRWVAAGVPCIAFSTEMGEQWIERSIAAEAGAPQICAEKQMWEKHPNELQLYLEQAERMRARADNWWVVTEPNVTPAEVAGRARILRRRWPDKTVVVFVDHMHRLDYGRDEADKKVGEATRMLRNLAKDENLIFVLVYQPRKPDVGKEPYGPISGDKIRGHSSVWNELNVHISPFRAWVATTDREMTDWGTPKAKMVPGSTFPEMVAPDPMAGDRKLDDERFYIKVDKRRVGGEGSVIQLPIQPIWGRIYEKWEKNYWEE